LELEVTDTGPGFPTDFLPHAFDRFGRADQSRTRAGAAMGTGLGLAIVATLTAAHGGMVTAANLPGGGAVLSLRLPAFPST
jgi:signal transduction histidine kinase